MTDPFSAGVEALDDALFEFPVFPGERGLSRRRERVEMIFALAARKYLLAALPLKAANGEFDDYTARDMLYILLETLPTVVEVSGVAGKRKELLPGKPYDCEEED